MARVDNKVEILRALERTEEQFDALVERNCKGQLQDPITVVTPRPDIGGRGKGGINTSVQPTVQGRTFSKEDKEFLEAFKKIYKDYGQAEYNAKNLEPVVFLKMNQCKPLAVVDAEYFLNWIKND